MGTAVAHGWILVGWGGIFDLVEGIVDHHILGLHHVREGTTEVLWDIASLGFGALLVLGGWLLQRSAPDQVGRSE